MKKKSDDKKRPPVTYPNGPEAPGFKIHGWLFGIFTCVLLVLIVSPSVHLPMGHYAVGEIATKNIKAAQTFHVEDNNATAQKRIEAQENVLPIYDYDPHLAIKQENKLSSAFSYIRENRLKYAIDKLGADRVILGSDTPWDKGSLRNGIARVDGLDITGTEKERILGRNITDILKP